MADKLFRSTNERIIAGVCGGIGDYIGLDPNIVRIIFALLVGVGGAGLVAYIVAWVILPEKPTA